MRTLSLMAGVAMAALAVVACSKPASDGAAPSPAATTEPATADPASGGASTSGTDTAGAVSQAPEDAPDDAGATTGANAGPVRGADPGMPVHVTTRYDCDGQAVSADYDNTAHTVAVRVGDQTLALPSAMSGSGARYADDKGNEFWEHQGEAKLTVAGGKQQTCKKAQATGS
ncbi:MAG TPA: MliC family protein [Stenotrophomonas sp.]|jgi:membrane-bound inhibitor of C-type lysozyme